MKTASQQQQQQQQRSRIDTAQLLGAGNKPPTFCGL